MSNDCGGSVKPDPNPSLTTKQHAIVSIQQDIVTCPARPEKFIRDIVIAPFLLVALSLSLSRE